MKIKVIYAHDVGYVEPYELDTLIPMGKIMGFVRNSKLVFVGLHPTRKAPSIAPDHVERRRSNAAQKG